MRKWVWVLILLGALCWSSGFGQECRPYDDFEVWPSLTSTGDSIYFYPGTDSAYSMGWWEDSTQFHVVACNGNFYSGWELRYNKQISYAAGDTVYPPDHLQFSNLNGAENVAVLMWNCDTTKAGFKIHYGFESGQYGNVIDVGMVTSYVIAGLVDTTYFFAVTGYDSTGKESYFSNEVTVKVEHHVAKVLRLLEGDVTGDGKCNFDDLYDFIGRLFGRELE